MEELNQWLPLLIPIALIEIGLLAVALVDLLRRERTKGPKWMWVIIILCFNLIGPIVYLLAGREE